MLRTQGTNFICSITQHHALTHLHTCSSHFKFISLFFCFFRCEMLPIRKLSKNVRGGFWPRVFIYFKLDPKCLKSLLVCMSVTFKPARFTEMSLFPHFILFLCLLSTVCLLFEVCCYSGIVHHITHCKPNDADCIYEMKT